MCQQPFSESSYEAMCAQFGSLQSQLMNLDRRTIADALKSNAVHYSAGGSPVIQGGGPGGSGTIYISCVSGGSGQAEVIQSKPAKDFVTEKTEEVKPVKPSWLSQIFGWW